MIMCHWFCDKIKDVPDFLDNVWFSDEAHLLLSGRVNSKNFPELFLQRSLHYLKSTAWVAISKRGIIGPFWFEDDNDNQQQDSTWSTEKGRQGPPVVPA